jgi:ubiquinone/menaquinone biosynthesis C-methylase UbiE
MINIHSGIIVGMIFNWVFYTQACGHQNIKLSESIDSVLFGLIENSYRDQWQKPDFVISLFGDPVGKKIMDLGSGDGYFTFRLALSGALVIAADINDDLHERIRSSLTSEEYDLIRKRIEFRKVPVDSPLLEENEVDGLLLVNTYHHLMNRIEYFKKMLPGIKKGGKVVVIDFKKDSDFGPPRSHKIELSEVVEELDKVGFSNLKIDNKSLKNQYIILGIR